MNIQNIKDLIGETTEYDKKAKLEKKKPKSWCKSISAFANGSGGALIWGINDNDEIIGVEDVKNDSEIISEQIKTCLNPIPNFDLKIKKIDEKNLIILIVYAGEQTPYYYSRDSALIAYHRVGNESVPVNPAKLQELVLKGSVSSFDNLKSKYSFDDMSFTKLRSIYKIQTGRNFEESDYESFGIIDENGFLTNAGALLADESPIRHSRLFCTRWNGLDKAPGIVDAIDDKEYNGGLINLLQSGIEFVNNNSKKMWKKTHNSRIEMPDYPERAVLEGIVNALIHRNYLELGSEVHIDMFDNRLEIYSPGGMCDGSRVQDRDIMKVPSRRRNPFIADIFNRLKFMDRRGSGFKKILSDYRDNEFYIKELDPIFYSDNDSFLLILKNINYFYDITDTYKRTAKKTQQNIVKIIAYLTDHNGATSKEIANILNLSTSRTRSILNQMNNIHSTGENNGKRYWLDKK